MKFKPKKTIFVVLLLAFFTIVGSGKYVDAQTINGPETNGSVTVKGKIGDSPTVEDTNQSENEQDSEHMNITADTSVINTSTFPKTGENTTNIGIYLGVLLLIISIYLIIKLRFKKISNS